MDTKSCFKLSMIITSAVLLSSCTLYSTKSLLKSTTIERIDSISINYVVITPEFKKKAKSYMDFYKKFGKDGIKISLNKEDITSNNFLVSNFIDSLKENIQYLSGPGTFGRNTDTAFAFLKIYLNNKEFLYLEYGLGLMGNSVKFTGESIWDVFSVGKSFDILYSNELYLEPAHLKHYLKSFVNSMVEYKNKSNSLQLNSQDSIKTILPLWEQEN